MEIIQGISGHFRNAGGMPTRQRNLEEIRGKTICGNRLGFFV
jgi:hypothetical protein